MDIRILPLLVLPLTVLLITTPETTDARRAKQPPPVASAPTVESLIQELYGTPPTLTEDERRCQAWGLTAERIAINRRHGMPLDTALRLIHTARAQLAADDLRGRLTSVQTSRLAQQIYAAPMQPPARLRTVTEILCLDSTPTLNPGESAESWR